MMSGADMKALEEAEKLRKYQDLAIEWLNQFDINAKGKEYPVEILKVFDAAREAKKRKDEEGNTDMLVGSVRTLFGAIKDIGRVSFSAFILPLAMALDRVLPNQVNITPFDFLYITLNSPVGGHGPHSFKFNFTCKLFELNSVELEKDSDILLSCMVDECKKRMTQRGNESAIKLVNFLKSVQKEKFLEAFDIANKASSSGLTHIKEAANSGEIDVYSAILECLNAKLALKNDQFRLILMLSLFEIKWEEMVEFTKLALLQRLEENDEEYRRMFGKDGIFYQNISGRFDNLKRAMAMKNENSQLFFREYIKNVEVFKSSAFIDSVTETMKRDESATLYNKVLNVVERCFSGEVGAQSMSKTFAELRNEEPKNLTEEASQGVLGFFNSVLQEAKKHTPRRAQRDSQIQSISKRLLSSNESDRLLPQDAVYEFLTSFVGGVGPHSLKFALASRLLNLQEMEVSDAYSRTVIDCIIQVIDEVRVQKARQNPVVAMGHVGEREEESKNNQVSSAPTI